MNGRGPRRCLTVDDSDLREFRCCAKPPGTWRAPCFADIISIREGSSDGLKPLSPRPRPPRLFPPGNRALRQPPSVTKAHGGKLTVLQVLVPFYMPADVPFGMPAVGEQRQVLQRLVTKVLGAGGPPVTMRVDIGAASQRIIDSARRADSIVMATSGRTGAAHFLIGSVAERVVRHATVPVLTPAGSHPEAPGRRQEEVDRRPAVRARTRRTPPRCPPTWRTRGPLARMSEATPADGPAHPAASQALLAGDDRHLCLAHRAGEGGRRGEPPDGALADAVAVVASAAPARRPARSVGDSPGGGDRPPAVLPRVDRHITNP